MRSALSHCLTLACALGALTPFAAANETEAEGQLPWKRGGVFIGGFLTRYDSSLSLGGDNAALEINLEDAVGLDRTTQDLRLGGYWRFGETSRHKVSLDWIQSKRTSSKVLQQDVTVGDTTYPEGTELSLDSSLSIIRTSYAYSFIMDERIDLSASFGLYTMPFSFEFQGITSNESSDFTAPLPVIGVHADIALAPDVFLKQSVDFFYLEYGSFTGSLADVYLGIEWYPWEHFGLGLGYETFRIAVDAEGQDIDLDGSVNYAQNGLLFYLTYAF